MPRKLPPFVERGEIGTARCDTTFRKGKGARFPLPGLETAEFEASSRTISRFISPGPARSACRFPPQRRPPMLSGASTPWTWKTDFAMSRPIVVTAWHE